MATGWRDMSRENLEAAKLLHDGGLARSSLSRTYYAAYAAVTGELIRGGWKSTTKRMNPGRGQVLKLIQERPTGRNLTSNDRRDLWKKIAAVQSIGINVSRRSGAELMLSPKAKDDIDGSINGAHTNGSASHG